MCVEFAYACVSDQVLKSIRQFTEIKMNCHYCENLNVVYRYHIKWRKSLLHTSILVIRAHVYLCVISVR
jgi:hypothetical protein